MDENELLKQIYAHKELTVNTSSALNTAHYLILHLEDQVFQKSERPVALFRKVLKKEFDLLSLDEYEQFMIKNEPYWQLYQKLFQRYRNLNETVNLKN